MRRSVLNHQHALTANGFGIFHKHRNGAFNDHSVGVQLIKVFSDRDHILQIGCVNLVDHEHIRQACVGFAGIMKQFMPGPMRVRHNDQQITDVEREVIVATVPHNDVDFFFSFA
ncbi:MAG: hypothetical protein BWX85_00794 [Chloroflexi bacterium ADurb.Bin120]|nr:MAG: hypothetical protein BWX85_00794 [Chloroflexi bacterium ADurb.Bin120]